MIEESEEKIETTVNMSGITSNIRLIDHRQKAKMRE